MHKIFLFYFFIISYKLLLNTPCTKTFTVCLDDLNFYTKKLNDFIRKTLCSWDYMLCNVPSYYLLLNMKRGNNNTCRSNCK